METHERPLSGGDSVLAARPTPILWGALLLAAALATVGLYLYMALLGQLLLGALAGGVLLLWAFRFPALLAVGLVLVAPLNYGFRVGGASIKLSELVVGAMLALILARLVAGDKDLFARLRRVWALALGLVALGLMAILTAAPHPNSLNVRYEIENYLACLFMLLFFRRAWWPYLLTAVLGALAFESVAALVLKFVFGLTGTSFFDAGGSLKLIQFTAEDLEGFAGGRFRLSGTMGHKNLLAAYIVLLLPLVGLEMLHRARLLWLAVLLPALATLALTDSMTGWSAIALVTVLGIIHLRRFDYLLLLMLLVLPVAGFGLYKFGDSVFMRIDQLLRGQEGWGTVSSRFEILNIALRLIHQYPWAGIGRNNFLAYGQTYYSHAHNLFLMKAIEMGLPAGIAFGVFLVALMGRVWGAILREGARLAREQQYYRTLGLWLGCLGFLTMNLFDYNYASFALGTLFMGLLGLLLAVALDLESPATPSPR